MERQLGRLEKQIERVEQQNANLKAELSKLRARVDQNTKDKKHTPDAPFTALRMWMLSTFRKQGLYRKQMFG